MKKRFVILLLFVGISFLISPDVFGQQTLRDSLINRLETAKKTEQIGIYVELSRLHLATSLVAALNFAEEALLLSEELDDKKGKADALNRKGNVYFFLADYEKSLGFYLESLALREELGEQEGIAGSYSNIALIYSEFNDNDRAIAYTQKSYETFKDLADKPKMGICLNNLTYLHLQTKQYSIALDYGQKTLELFNEIEDPSGISDALNNLGDIYKETGKFDEALLYHRQSLNLNIETENPYSTANSRYNIAQLHMKTGEYEKVIQNLSEGLPIAIDLQSNDLIKDMYKLMADYYESQKDYLKALEFYDLHTQVADSIYNQESNDRIAAMQVKFEAESKTEEIKLLKQDQDIKNLQTKKQKNLIKYLIISSLLITAFGFIGLNSYRRKRSINEQLRDQNFEYFYTNRDLSLSENNLRDLNTTKDKFFSIIGHDLINPFQALLGLAELLHDECNEISKEDIRKYSHLINISANNLFNLLQNLLHWASAQTGKLNYEPVDFNLFNQVEDTIALLRANAEEKHILLVNETDKMIRIHADVNIFSTVLRNLVSNAIKYTSRDGFIRVQSEETESAIQVEVEDNGIGIPQENMDKLFNLEKTFSTKGTFEEEGSGLGLILCKEFTEKNGGQIWADSIPGQGSRFIFTVPKMN